MTRKELNEKLTGIVREYIDNERALIDPQIRINPVTLDIGVVTAKEMFAELEDYDEMLEGAAAVDGAADEEKDDYQVAQDPDFYSVRELVFTRPDGKQSPDPAAIEAIAEKYRP